MNSNKDIFFILELHGKNLYSPPKDWYLWHFYISFHWWTGKKLAALCLKRVTFSIKEHVPILPCPF